MKKRLWPSILLALPLLVRGAAEIRLTAPLSNKDPGQRPPALVIGSTYTIRWTATELTAPVRIVLRRGDQPVGMIAESVPPTPGEFIWTVGAFKGGTAAAGEGYFIRVRSNSGVEGNDSQPFILSLQGPAAPPPDSPLAVTFPAGGETLTAGQKVAITWKADALPDSRVEITLFIAAKETSLGPIGGATLAEDVPALDGSYAWRIGRFLDRALKVGPGTYPNCKIRLWTRKGSRVITSESGSFTVVVPE